MKRALAAVMAFVFVTGACSGKADPSGDPANPSAGPSIETASPDGELGSPIEDGESNGHYVPLKSSRSYETLKAAADPLTNQSGVLLAVTNGDHAGFIVAMEDDAAKYLRVNKGWKVAEIGRDTAWRPGATAGVPHVAVGSNWVVALRTTTTDDDRGNPEGVGNNVLMESYDTTGKTYYTTSAIDSSQSLFVNSLQVVDDHRFSFLFADGGIDDERIPFVMRRTVDLSTFRFVDEAIDIGGTDRLVNASALDDGYLVELQNSQSQRTGVFVRLAPSIGEPTLALTMRESPAPATIDGFHIEDTAKPLALVGATGAKTMLPADFASAAVAGAVDDLVYLYYVASPARAISADGLAVVDVTRGTISTAFDLSGTDRDATGPSADAAWATGASRVTLLGVPAI